MGETEEANDASHEIIYRSETLSYLCSVLSERSDIGWIEAGDSEDEKGDCAQDDLDERDWMESSNSNLFQECRQSGGLGDSQGPQTIKEELSGAAEALTASRGSSK